MFICIDGTEVGGNLCGRYSRRFAWAEYFTVEFVSVNKANRLCSQVQVHGL